MRGKTSFHIRWKLFFYDVIVFAVTSVFLLVLYEGPVKLTQRGELQQMLLAFVCVFACRLVGKIYGQIWRYGGIQCYMRLVCTDCVAFLIYVILESVLPVAHISFPRLLALSTVNTMGALIMRMSYRYAYKCSNLETFSGKILAALLKIFAGIEVGETRDDQKIKVAIIGAGNVGVTLAGELLANKMASYVPKCFVDIDKSKGGREIQGLPVLSENEATFQKLKKYGIQEIIFALPSMADERRTERYLYYKNAGYKVKMYDYPKMQMAGGKRSLREFDIEELLFRAPRKLTNEKTDVYYNDKVILVTGGGGSLDFFLRIHYNKHINFFTFLVKNKISKLFANAVPPALLQLFKVRTRLGKLPAHPLFFRAFLRTERMRKLHCRRRIISDPKTESDHHQPEHPPHGSFRQKFSLGIHCPRRGGTKLSYL